MPTQCDQCKSVVLQMNKDDDVNCHTYISFVQARFLGWSIRSPESR